MSDAGTPGWYPDPYRRFELRYYNGLRWTGDVSTHGNRMIDPLAPGPAMPLEAGSSTPPGARPGAPLRTGPSPSDGGPAAPHGTGPAAPYGTGPAAPAVVGTAGPSGSGPSAPSGVGPAGPFGSGPSAPSGVGPAGPFGSGPSAPSGVGRGAPFAPTAHRWGDQPQWSSASFGGFAAGPQRPKRGKAISAFVLAVSAAAVGWFPFVFAVAAIAVVLALVFGVGGLRAAKAQDGAGRGFSIAALVISPVALAICVGGFFFTRFVMREIERYDHPGSSTVTVNEAATNGTTTTCSGTIRNEESDTRSYELSISYGQDGVKLATDVVDVNDVAAGATARWSDAQRITRAGTITCEVTAVRGPAPFGIRPTT